jgi:cytosine/adenosine deaminase-related metal-dependent hydrolase
MAYRQSLMKYAEKYGCRTTIHLGQTQKRKER